jgi:hypothetical protein
MNEHDYGPTPGLTVRHPMTVQDPLVDLEFLDRAQGSSRSCIDANTLARPSDSRPLGQAARLDGAARYWWP